MVIERELCDFCLLSLRLIISCPGSQCRNFDVDQASMLRQMKEIQMLIHCTDPSFFVYLGMAYFVTVMGVFVPACLLFCAFPLDLEFSAHV